MEIKKLYHLTLLVEDLPAGRSVLRSSVQSPLLHARLRPVSPPSRRRPARHRRHRDRADATSPPGGRSEGRRRSIASSSGSALASIRWRYWCPAPKSWRHASMRRECSGQTAAWTITCFPTRRTFRACWSWRTSAIISSASLWPIPAFAANTTRHTGVTPILSASSAPPITPWSCETTTKRPVDTSICSTPSVSPTSPDRTPGARSAYVAFPDGTVIELAEPIDASCPFARMTSTKVGETWCGLTFRVVDTGSVAAYLDRLGRPDPVERRSDGRLWTALTRSKCTTPSPPRYWSETPERTMGDCEHRQ